MAARVTLTTRELRSATIEAERGSPVNIASSPMVSPRAISPSTLTVPGSVFRQRAEPAGQHEIDVVAEVALLEQRLAGGDVDIFGACLNDLQNLGAGESKMAAQDRRQQFLLVLVLGIEFQHLQLLRAGRLGRSSGQTFSGPDLFCLFRRPACQTVAESAILRLETDAVDCDREQKGLSMDGIAAAAKLIAAARRSRAPLASLPGEIAPQSEAAGYRVQDAVHDLLIPDLGPLVGHKIGCTSAVMQQYLAIPHPCGGGVFERGVHHTGAVLRHGDFVRVGVECEIGVRLGRDLEPGGAPFTADGVAPAIEAYLPSIEIVDERYVDWRTIGAPTLVADDFFAAGCVFGQPVPRSSAPDLRTLGGRALINGVEAGRGSGADVLGHPHNALAWLANHLASGGMALRAGEIVLTGSLVQTVWLKAGDKVLMDLSALGTVTAEFRS